MRRQLSALVLLSLFLLLLVGCGEIPELPAQALAPVISTKVVNCEPHLIIDVGPLPQGVTARTRGFKFGQGQDEEAGIYWLKLHDILREQNVDEVNPFTVDVKLIYEYNGRLVRTVPLAHQVYPFTYLMIEPMQLAISTETTTADNLQLTGAVAPGARLTVNGVQLKADSENRYSCTVPLPQMGINEIVVGAERPGEVATGFTCKVNRLGIMSTQELRPSISLVTGGIATDMAGAARPISAVTMQDILRQLFAAPIIDQPELDPSGEVGLIAIRLYDKEAQLHVADSYLSLNGVHYRLPASAQEAVTACFVTPYEWPFSRWDGGRTEGLLPPGAEVLALSLGVDNGPLRTLLLVNEGEGDAASVIERIVEVTLGKFEVYVKQASIASRNAAVVLDGWDERREFTLKQSP